MVNFYTEFHQRTGSQYQHVAMSQEWLLSRIKQSLNIKNEGKIRLVFNILTHVQRLEIVVLLRS